MSKWNAYGLSRPSSSTDHHHALSAGGHVVGNDVEHDPEPFVVRDLDEFVERRLTPELLAKPIRIDNVVTVRAALRRFEARREVQVAHAKVAQVGHDRRGVAEAEVRPQLQPVGTDELGSGHPMIATL